MNTISNSVLQADNREVDWKQSFYGSNYQQLYSIKAKYDPDHVFYANTSVGSDDWYVQGNGALCYIGDSWGGECEKAGRTSCEEL